jgi:hypothetical protein
MPGMMRIESGGRGCGRKERPGACEGRRARLEAWARDATGRVTSTCVVLATTRRARPLPRLRRSGPCPECRRGSHLGDKGGCRLRSECGGYLCLYRSAAFGRVARMRDSVRGTSTSQDAHRHCSAFGFAALRSTPTADAKSFRVQRASPSTSELIQSLSHPSSQRLRARRVQRLAGEGLGCCLCRISRARGMEARRQCAPLCLAHAPWRAAAASEQQNARAAFQGRKLPRPLRLRAMLPHDCMRPAAGQETCRAMVG